jgi:hypothetical protein
MALPRTVARAGATGAGGDMKDRIQQTSGSAPGGGAVFGLGLIGALVWFWQQAEGFGEHVVAVLKALVWPAFLVYDAFKALHG